MSPEDTAGLTSAQILTLEAVQAFKSQCKKNAVPYSPRVEAAFRNAIVGLVNEVQIALVAQTQSPPASTVFERRYMGEPAPIEPAPISFINPPSPRGAFYEFEHGGARRGGKTEALRNFVRERYRQLGERVIVADKRCRSCDRGLVRTPASGLVECTKCDGTGLRSETKDHDA